ncbi:MAG: GNAT family N-acetyltransferase [Acidobacteriota bacterium]
MLILNPIRLVRARHSDRDRVLLIERAVFPDEPFSPEQVRHMLHSASARTLLLMTGTEPVGLVALWWRRGASTCRIIDLAVRPRFRRRGLGTRLVRAALRDGRRHGFAGVTLEVAETNHPARSLYESQGFCHERRLPDYYDRHRHAIRMIRWLRVVPCGRTRPAAGRGMVRSQ